ncbi:hypothetical protein [Deinococcus soli (ex Cha et al. 2016)]|uniref:hypothetical protein n=1 Tax=Deinococcus soli (ex Cha et al. 2016) TaxID=1309411 RepID=UPI0016696D14|nr:hypothetical protein [Deinococcus soli (ex Cha et al. 2016)]
MGLDVMMGLLAVASSLERNLRVAFTASDFNCPAPLPTAALSCFLGAYSTQTVDEAYQAVVVLETNDPSVMANPEAFAGCGWRPLSRLQPTPTSPALAYIHPIHQLVLRINVGTLGEDSSWWRIDGSLTYHHLVLQGSD